MERYRKRDSFNFVLGVCVRDCVCVFVCLCVGGEIEAAFGPQLLGREGKRDRERSGVNFTNVLRTAFSHVDPKCIKRY